jgi:hypothetical protein
VVVDRRCGECTGGSSFWYTVIFLLWYVTRAITRRAVILIIISLEHPRTMQETPLREVVIAVASDTTCSARSYRIMSVEQSA